MIPELEEQYNHTKANLSISIADREDGQPACPTGQPACPPATRGFTLEDIEAIEEGIEHAYEGTAPLPTTDKPRLVTRGPHSQPPPPPKQSTKLDTLSFTAKEPYWIFQELVELCCPGVSFIKLKTGKNGYHSGFNVVKDKREIAQIFYGSHSNERQNIKPQLMIGGNGKTDMFNWSLFHHYATMMDSPTITRADVCLDIFDGSTSIEDVIQAHLDGRFRTLKSNKDPRITPYGQIQPDGKNFGRTIYIGATASSKSVRFYEKGFEMFKGILNSEDAKDSLMREIMEDTMATGKPIVVEGVNDDQAFDLGKWLRAEVQFRSSNCVIPMDILLNTDDYFSGAYPFLQELLNMNDGKTPPRLKTVDEIELAVRIQNMKAIAGSLIEDLLCLGWSNDDVVEALRGGKGASQKLIRSGAYKDC